jgi:hypothetical protein
MTAVEYIKKRIEEDSDTSFSNIDWDKFDEIFEQAKEMELQQRQEDTNYGYSQGWYDGNQNKEPMRPELKQQEQ